MTPVMLLVLSLCAGGNGRDGSLSRYSSMTLIINEHGTTFRIYLYFLNIHALIIITE